MEGKSYHHGDLKAELIREGLKILDREGYEGFSLRKVANACHVSQTAPYRHFQSKEELIRAITLHAMHLFNDSLEQAVKQSQGDEKQQLKEMGIAYVRFFSDNPEYLRLLFLSDIRPQLAATSAHDVCEHEQAMFSEGDPFGTFYQAVQAYRTAYPDVLMSQDELVLYCWGLVHGFATLLVGGEMPHGEQTLALVERIIRSEGFLK